MAIQNMLFNVGVKGNPIYQLMESLITNGEETINLLRGLPSMEQIGVNMSHKFFGTGMTTQQREEMAAQYDYQRALNKAAIPDQVAGMNEAGVNPALMYGSASTASPASAPSANPSAASLSELVAMATLPAQLGIMKAQKENIEADTGNKQTIKNLNQQDYDLREKLNPLLVEAQGISNNVGRATESKIYKELDRMAEETKKLAEEAKTEREKQMYYKNAAILEEINAKQAIELLPYKIALNEAQTQQAKAAAALSFAQAAYQKKLLDSDYIDSLIASAAADAKGHEAKAAIDDLKSRIKTGRLINFGDSIAGQIADGVFNYPIAVLSNLLDGIGPLLGIGAIAVGLKGRNTSALNAPNEIIGLAGID